MTALTILHHPARNCFETHVDGVRAELDYRLDGQIMRIHHTGVPRELEGRGIAAALVQTAVDHARTSGLRIDPLCSYVRVWKQRHPEAADLFE